MPRAQDEPVRLTKIYTRAEREAIAAAETVEIRPVVVPYLKRVSVLLFIRSRAANAFAERREPEQQPAERRQAGHGEPAAPPNADAELERPDESPEGEDAHDRTEEEGGGLSGEAADPERERETCHCEREARAIRRKRAPHGSGSRSRPPC